MKLWTVVAAVSLFILSAESVPAAGPDNGKGEENMQRTRLVYKAADFPNIAGTPGFSGRLLDDHLKLYQGYVNNTNTLSEKLAEMREDGRERTPEYAELKRRFGWEFDGMRLHELYFGNLGGAGTPKLSGALYRALRDEYGAFEDWKRDFIATGLIRGIGWAVLYQDNVSGRLFNFWINEHDTGHPAGCRPLLVMDVFEHAYMTDYGLDRAAYIDAFMKAVDWDEAERRFAKQAAPQP